MKSKYPKLVRSDVPDTHRAVEAIAVAWLETLYPKSKVVRNQSAWPDLVGETEGDTIGVEIIVPKRRSSLVSRLEQTLGRFYVQRSSIDILAIIVSSTDESFMGIIIDFDRRLRSLSGRHNVIFAFIRLSRSGEPPVLTPLSTTTGR